MKHVLLIVTFFITCQLSAQDLVVNTFSNYTHTGAGTYNESFSFPADNSIYDQILMNVALTCPPGGCDPWDRFASLKVVNNGEEIEIRRYITPYGNNWCTWQLDVSDYRELLEGNVELESYIETWSNGWNLTVDFEFYLGTPTYDYVDIANVWVDYDFTYGDTIFFSIDLPEKTLTIPSNAEKTVLRVVNTGHGQANTDNAAEFSQKTHDIVVNGNIEFNQFLWDATCSTNPCSPQGGTWQFARAGWCPGAQVDPTDYDITSLVTPGNTVTLDYELEPYFNDCSPWNPSCSDGVTCTECTYNGGSHTKPNYKYAIQLISYSSTPIQITSVEEQENFGLVKLFPNPSNGDETRVFIQINQTDDVQIEIVSATGEYIMSRNTGPVQGSLYHSINTKNLTNGVYFINTSVNGHTHTNRLIINK